LQTPVGAEGSAPAIFVSSYKERRNRHLTSVCSAFRIAVMRMHGLAWMDLVHCYRWF